MLPRQHRLNKSADLRHVLRRGRRFAFAAAVISTLNSSEITPSRLGLVVSKQVGNSVVRHRVARSIRHAAAAVIAQRPTGIDFAVRALPGAQSLSVSEWTEQLNQAITKADKAGQR